MKKVDIIVAIFKQIIPIICGCLIFQIVNCFYLWLIFMVSSKLQEIGNNKASSAPFKYCFQMAY